MKKLQRVRTRRQLLRVTAMGAAGIPFLALAQILSNVVDVRDPIQIAYDQLAQRAEAMMV